MTSRFLRTCIVAGIAFLQCFVPLIHAHAHEMPGKGHIHIHLAEFGAGEQTAPNPAIKAPDTESTAIGVSQEFKRDYFLLPILGAVAVLFLLAAVVGRRIFPQPQVLPRTGSPQHHRPPATAPPPRAA